MDASQSWIAERPSALLSSTFTHNEPSPFPPRERGGNPSQLLAGPVCALVNRVAPRIHPD